ncbi:hypothetical protein DFH06DRAFT_687162 [Mycena polygramma]|nr:hypothetical protein DFH06DRAFT_687162 [Mycena polygramma]
MDQITSAPERQVEYVQHRFSVLPPIRRVPPELICEIFSWTLSGTENDAGSGLKQPPWYLGHISQTWREIALALPSLWSSITVFHQHQKISSLPMIQAQLARSGNVPLHVDFKWLSGTFDEAAPLMCSLLPHCERWGSLRFLCREDSDKLLEILRPAKGRLPQLHSLEILDRGDWEPLSEASDLFSTAPNLREILFTNSSFDNYSPHMLIPWGQITRYRAVVDVDELLNILRQTSNLVEGALGLAEPAEAVLNNNTIITLPHLRRLFVEQSVFLTRLTTPSLEYLSCDSVHSLLPFVQRSSCHLTTLVLTEGSMTISSPFSLVADDLLLLLQNTPHLKNLVLQASEFRKQDNDRVLRSMTVAGSSEDLCPLLVRLAYGSAHESNVFAGELFCSMIRSRLHPDRKCRLSCLRLFSYHSIPDIETEDDTLEWMQLLINEGLDVEVVHDPTEFVNQARHSFVLGF